MQLWLGLNLHSCLARSVNVTGGHIPGWMSTTRNWNQRWPTTRLGEHQSGTQSCALDIIANSKQLIRLTLTCCHVVMWPRIELMSERSFEFLAFLGNISRQFHVWFLTELGFCSISMQHDISHFKRFKDFSELSICLSHWIRVATAVLHILLRTAWV